MDTKNKKNLGQFFTTNYKHILQDLKIPEDVKNIIEPFTGDGDLLNFIEDKKIYKIECYDLDPKKDFIVKRDTIKNPVDHENKFSITNPPYLARNKSSDKTLFDKYDVNDLYKCYIINICTNSPVGGIIIIPLNFWSSIRKNDIDLRETFLNKFKVLQLNIFEEKVFNDTSYTVCSFQYKLKDMQDTNNEIKITIYPSKEKLIVNLNNQNNYTIGGNIYNLVNKDVYKITRLTIKNKENKNTNILVKCIDDNLNNKICLKYVSDKEIYIDETPNLSSRTYATLIIEPPINSKKQKKLVDKFNNFLNEYRNKYNSLFLTNYRESKDIARKRISFDLVYSIVGYILENFNSELEIN
jgi:hypothetical protein